MPLPGVNIIIENGALSSGALSNDRTCGLILTGSSVQGAGNVITGKAYNIFSLEQAIDLGVKPVGVNAFAYQHIKDFYDAAGVGSNLWIMLVPMAVTMEEMLDLSKDYASVLLDAARGGIRKLGVSRKSSSGVSIENGLDSDVDKALIKGQALAKMYSQRFKPFRLLIDGKDFNGNVGDLKDYRTAQFNRAGVLIGSISTGKNAAIGFTLGYMASLDVQRKISRVKNGALPISKAYFTDGSDTEDFQNAWENIHDKGYIFFRTFIGKSGYFFSDDPTATSSTDDYGQFSRGFVMDKALVLTYQVFIDEIGDEIQVDENGKLNPALVKALQGKIEQVIKLQMLAPGQISDVKAHIDPFQNILSSNKLEISLKIQPVGYKNFIEIRLGFSNPANT